MWFVNFEDGSRFPGVSGCSFEGREQRLLHARLGFGVWNFEVFLDGKKRQDSLVQGCLRFELD